MTNPNVIIVRWPHEEMEQDFKIPGILVNENVALTLFDEHVEVHLVEQSSTPGEYELRYASNPMFYVGNDLPTIVHDLTSLTFADFASKYTHSDFQGLCSLLQYQC